MAGDDSRLVYSDELGGRVGDAEKKKPRKGKKTRGASAPLPADGVVRVRRETGGRGGKTVTAVHGIPLAGSELKALAKALKKKCGTGGAVKDGVVEIQGDHRETVQAELERRGYTVKLAGG
jgi:translation initiation factor 1